MSSIKQRLLCGVASISVRSDAVPDGPDHRRDGLPGNPRGFGTIRVPKRLWQDPSIYGATERIKHLRAARSG